MYIISGVFMKTAKIFQNGQSQAVRLPKEFRFADNEVYIKRSGRVVHLIPQTILGMFCSTAWKNFPATIWLNAYSQSKTSGKFFDVDVRHKHLHLHYQAETT